MANYLDASLDFLVGASDEQMDKTTMKRILELQKLPDEDKQHIFYTLDSLIKAAKFNVNPYQKKSTSETLALVFLFTSLDQFEQY